MNNETVLLVSDLMSRQQIKAVFTNNKYIKEISDLETLLARSEPERFIADLANNKLDIIQALDLIAKAGYQSKTICFYPHVETELARQVSAMGFDNLLIRSKFFSNLQSFLNE